MHLFKHIERKGTIKYGSKSKEGYGTGIYVFRLDEYNRGFLEKYG
ncbi:hypothetical protein GMMP13_1300006 [Candidatus Magnetomoraceae bacterium gMMP-13]